MLERGKMDRNKIEFVDTEGLVPADHLLRKIDAAVDFSKIYKMVEELTGEEEVIYGDSGYLGAEKREDAVIKNKQGKKVRYKVNSQAIPNFV